MDYNKEGLAHKQEYVKMFEDCGWEYLQDFMGYSYFRKPIGIMNADESIFCDYSSRLEMVQRVFRGRMIPLLIIFCCVIIPQLFIQFGNGETVIGSMFMLLLLLYVSIFIAYGKKYAEFKKKVGKW